VKRHLPAVLAAMSSILAIVLTLAGCFSSPPPGSPARITILHTNDTHGFLDNIAQRATLVKQTRNEIGNDNVLLLDAGDVFAGTPYFTLFHGQADRWFMNDLKYDAMCLGNHDFDLKPEGLADFLGQAAFPVLCANFDFSKESALKGAIKPWVIVDRAGDRFGIFSVTTEDTGETSQPGPNIIISDHTAAARQAVAELQARGINKIIALTHIGWDKDLDLARQVSGIDVIVGGHSHTVADPYPAVVSNSGAPTLVVQTGWQNTNLGRLNLNFDGAGVIKSWGGSQLIPITTKIDADPASAAALAGYQKPVKELMEKPVGRTLVLLDGERANVRSRETNLGNLLADALLASAAKEKATICIINGGAIRLSAPVGDITLGQIMTILPYASTTVALDLTGKQIVTALENGVSQVEQLTGRFPQVSGLRFSWDAASPPGNRIKSVEVKTQAGYRPLDPEGEYRVVTNSFVADGGDGYDIFKEAKNTVYLGVVDYEILADYIAANSPVNPQVEGRIKRQ